MAKPKVVKLKLGVSRQRESHPATLKTGLAPEPRVLKTIGRPIPIPMPDWALEDWKDPDHVTEYPPMEKEHWTIDSVCNFVLAYRRIVREAIEEERREACGSRRA